MVEPTTPTNTTALTGAMGPRPALNTLAPSEAWDAVVIGGGITGAGIALELARRRLRVLLVEQHDFSWGTSSRSSKMVHGGLRYIAQGDVKLTRHALQERERLLVELPELVSRMAYLFPIRQGRFPGRWPMTFILKVYDLLAGIRDHRWVNRQQLLKDYPALQADGLRGAMRYTDALTDDSRLVIRVLQEAVAEGAVVRNYTPVLRLYTDSAGVMLDLQDGNSGPTQTVRARRVFNATGLWVDQLSGTPPKVRPQRGAHLFVAHQRLPVNDCLTLLHPQDKRPVFVFPWKGQTCIGTTDIDHRGDPNTEPHCTAEELDYLLQVVNTEMPTVQLGKTDILGTMAGVRPIIASGTGRDPSKERRDHLVWRQGAVISVSGGKLTTFRQIALDALKTAELIGAREHAQAHGDRQRRCFNHVIAAPSLLNDPFAAMAQGPELLAHVDWVLRHEMVHHLDDLMLRRLRAGVLLADGGQSLLPEIRPVCQHHLHWDDARWHSECVRYQQLLHDHYRLV